MRQSQGVKATKLETLSQLKNSSNYEVVIGDDFNFSLCEYFFQFDKYRISRHEVFILQLFFSYEICG